MSVGLGGAEADGLSWEPAISADGRWVAFSSRASNLVPVDDNGLFDVFVADLKTGALERVSRDPGQGDPDGESTQPCISADGMQVAFVSGATNLVAGDVNGALDVSLRDRTTGTTERVSVATGGEVRDNAYSNSPAISADGSRVVFTSWASNLVVGDSNALDDVFLRDRVSGVRRGHDWVDGGAVKERGGGRIVVDVLQDLGGFLFQELIEAQAATPVVENHDQPRCHAGKGIIKIGAKQRIEELSKGNKTDSPKHRPPYIYTVPLAEVIGLARGVSTLQSASIQSEWRKMIERFGPEIKILIDKDVKCLKKYDEAIGGIIGEFREGKMQYDSGGGGKYGKPIWGKPLKEDYYDCSQKRLSQF